MIRDSRRDTCICETPSRSPISDCVISAPKRIWRIHFSRSFSPSISDWARAAFEVRGRWPGGDGSVGIPTWFYGHEPPNAFAGHIAKYFANATREDGLLARCNSGVVFLPGAAGTVQEIFDNATPNYYQSRGEPTPMVLVDRAHWTERLPAWPLLMSLARKRSMESRIALVDSVAEAPEALARLSA